MGVTTAMVTARVTLAHVEGTEEMEVGMVVVPPPSPLLPSVSRLD